MIIRLCDSVAMTRSRCSAQRIGLEDRFVGGGGVPLQPGQQGGPYVETQVFIVIEKIGQASVIVKDPGVGIGCVAFLRHSFVPVMERVG